MDKFLCGLALAGVLLAVSLPDVHPQSLAEDNLLTADAAMCNGTAQNGTIVLSPSLNVTRCNITVPGSSSHVTTILFSRLDLKGADNLTISDGSTELLNVTGSRQSLAVVVTSDKAYLIVYITADASGSILEATYNSTACNIEQTVNANSVLQSPAYLPNKRSFNCSYLLRTGVSGSKLALSFTQLALTNATLNISSPTPGKNTVISGTNLPPDVYGSDKLQMVLTVPKNKSMQNFTAFVTPITSSPGCGLVKNVSATDTLNITVPASQGALMGYDCHVTLQAAKGKSLWMNLTSLQLAAHGDRLEVVDGGAMASGNSLAAFTASSSSFAGYLVLSSQKQVLVRLSLGLMSATRSLTFDLKDLDYVGHMYQAGNFAMAPAPGAAMSTSYYVLESAASSVVNFKLAKETANKTYKYNVSVYDGDQTGSPLLVTFSSGQRVPVVSSGNKVLLVVSQVNASQPLSASFSSQSPGCDKVTSAPAGSFQLMTSPSAPSKCTWTVTAPPSSNGTILLDMMALKLPQKATVSVYSGVAGSGGSLVAQLSSLNTLASAPLPSVAVPASQWAQVVWSSGNKSDTNSAVVNVRYQLWSSLCGGQIQATQGHLRSPAFPNLYPLNTMCQWTFPPSPKPGRVLLFDFPQFQLAPNHSVVISETVNGSSRQVAKLNGSDPLPDVLFVSNATNTLTFSAKSVAVSSQVAQGFDIQYWTLSCGGLKNKSNDSFTSPGYPAQIPVAPANATLCAWKVQLPNKTGDNLNIVNLTLQFDQTGSPPVTEMVKVYDGDTVRHSPIAWNASKDAKFSVNALSRYNTVLLVFNVTAKGKADANAKLALRVNYTTFSCNKTLQCGNGICMHPDWRCNGNDDCGDNTDERNCVGPPAPVNPQSSGTKPAIVVLLFFVGLILGILLTVIIPRIIRRFRTNRYSTFRDEPVA